MKKILAIILMLTLLIGVPASCGNGEKADEEAAQKGEWYFHVAQELLDDGTATAEQKQVFAELGKIIDACRKNDSCIIDKSYQDTIIDTIDFRRLYTLLYNLNTWNWDAVEEH